MVVLGHAGSVQTAHSYRIERALVTQCQSCGFSIFMSGDLVNQGNHLLVLKVNERDSLQRIVICAVNKCSKSLF